MSVLTRFKGDTYSVEAVLTKEGVAIDLTPGNYTASFGFAKGTKRVVIPGANGTANGEVSFPFPAAVTAGTYKYDIQVTSNTGEIRTYTKDTLEIIGDIT